MKAKSAMQCKPAPNAKPGDFLYQGDIKNNPVIVSPVFDDYAALCQWAMANGWKYIGANIADNTYEKADTK